MLQCRPPVAGFTTRFAPAPTGFLHLGHVANALAVWGIARAFGGRVLLRIEDHDRTRSRSEFEAAILEDLRWLGFESDAPLTRQSDRGELYASALETLSTKGLVYACACSRKTIEVSGPVDGEKRYPGTCRAALADGQTQAARRIHLDPTEVEFDDLRLGPQTQTPAEQCGDLLARDRNGNWTYQFAVVVDDMNQGVDLVIRGEDLLSSTGRQIQVARLLGRAAPPRFLHHALITHPDGMKLSKSNRDTGVRDLRARGYSVERILGMAAASLGLSKGDPASFGEIAERLATSSRVST